LGNVSEACRRHGTSRTVFYRWRQRLEQYGPDGVHPKRRQARRGWPPAVPVQTERRVIAFALAWPLERCATSRDLRLRLPKGPAKSADVVPHGH
jgi:transposase-like protein